MIDTWALTGQDSINISSHPYVYMRSPINGYHPLTVIAEFDF